MTCCYWSKKKQKIKYRIINNLQDDPQQHNNIHNIIQHNTKIKTNEYKPINQIRNNSTRTNRTSKHIIYLTFKNSLYYLF